MNTLLWLALLGLATLATAHFEKGHDFCSDEKDRFDDCKPLVSHEGCGCSSSSSEGSNEGGVTSSGGGEISGSGSGSGSGEIGGSGSGSSEEGSGEWKEGEYCFLLQVFLNYSIVLEEKYQVIFIEWINKTQEEIIDNDNLTEYEKLVEVWYSLEILFVEYYEIEINIKFLYIGEWGYVCDLEGLAIDIQTITTTVTIHEVIEISGNNGSCPLTHALDECGQAQSGSDQDAIESLVSEITVVIEAGYSFSETLVLIYEKFEAFFEKHAALKSVVFKWNIKGFGCIQSYYDICATYWRIANFKLAAGGDSSSCALVEALNELWQNTSYSDSQRSDFKELYKKMLNYTTVEVSVELRVQYFVEQVYQLLILAEWDIKALYICEIKGYGTIYQFIYAYIYCTNNGIGSGDFTGGPSNAPVTTTAAQEVTTSAASGDCSTVTKVNVYTVSTNITILLQSIDDAQSSWSTTDINQFSGYKKRIYNYSTNTTCTDAEKFNAIKNVFTGFAGSSDTKTKVFAVYIKSWGTVTQYCDCSL